MALSWVTTVTDTNYARAWRNRDALVARAASPVTAAALPLDQRTQARFLAAFVAPGSAPNALLTRAPEDSTLFAGNARPVSSGDIHDALVGRPAPPRGPSFFAEPNPVSLEALSTWRAVARAQPLPVFWPFRDGVASPEPIAIDPETLHTLAAANFHEVLHRDGPVDLAVIEARARENLAVARQLNRAGAAPFMVIGAITSDAAEVLDYVGRTRGEPALVAEAAALRSAGVFRPTSAAAGALFADPSYLPITRLVADTLLEPATRVQLAQLAAAGFCKNPREVLFGPAISRVVLAKQAAEGVRDLPGAERLVGPWDRWLSQSIGTGLTPLTAAPGVAQPPPPPGRAVRFATGLFRLHGLRSRLAYCSQS